MKNKVQTALPDGWQMVSLGEVCEIIMGQSPSGKSVIAANAPNPSLRGVENAEAIHKADKIRFEPSGSRNDENSGIEFHQGKIYFTDKFLAKSDFITTQPLKIAQPNSILLCVRAPVGVVNFTQRKIAIGRGLCAIKAHKANNEFVYFSLLGLKDYFESKSAGSTFSAINSNEIKNARIPLPPMDEQNKIARILSTWDKAINTLDKLIATKVRFKKGLMQGLLTPHAPLRFAEFKDEWQEVRLGEVCKIQCGYAFESKKFTDSGMPIVRISNLSNDTIYMDMKDLVFYDTISKDENFIIQENDLLVALSGATAGKVSIYNLPYKSYLNQRVGVFRLIKKEILDYKFLTQWVLSNKFKDKIKTMLSIGAQPNISPKDIENFKFKIPPTLQEQNKIAQVLTTCDKELGLLRAKLNGFKKQKKALMQRLLSGEIRVNL